MSAISAESTANLGRIVRRVTIRLIPILLLMYILAFLDRSNLGFAKAAYQADTGISDAAYALGAGIFFLGYAAVEVPSNLIMRRVGAKIWLARIMITWGIVSSLMVFASNEWIFYFLRVLLGITEAGFFPGVILFLTYWIPRQYRARVNGIFYFGAPLAFIFGGPLSGALLQVSGGLHGWQWMFLITGILTVTVGIVAFFYLDNGPQTARWLNNEDRIVLTTALAQDETDREAVSPRGALKALISPRVLFFAVIYFTIQMSVYGVTFYLPTQIATIVGAPVGLAVGLLTAVPWGFALITTIVLTQVADRTGQRRVIAGIALAVSSIGILIAGFAHTPVLGLIALSVGAAGFISVQPLFWTLPTSFVVGGAAAAGIALINALGSLGGFVAPVLKTAVEAGDPASPWGFVALAIIAFVGAIMIFLSRLLSGGSIARDEQSLSAANRS